jgi:ABC-2 type transport system permease protein
MTALPVTPARPSRIGVTFPRVLRSEWIKTRTVRSTVWTLALTVLLMVGFSTLFSWGTSSVQGDGGPAAGVGTGSALAVFMVTVGYGVAQLTLAVLGVLAITTEYSTGMVRSTFAAVPTRLPALGAKALIVAPISALTAMVALGLS